MKRLRWGPVFACGLLFGMLGAWSLGAMFLVLLGCGCVFCIGYTFRAMVEPDTKERR